MGYSRSSARVATRSAYFNNGYCAVFSEGRFGYVNEMGEVTCPVEHDQRLAEIFSHFAISSGLDGSQAMISAEGGLVDKDFAGLEAKFYTDNDSKLLKAQDASGKWGVVDWLGNAVVDFNCSSPERILINRFGTLAFVDDDDFNRTVYLFDGYPQ